MPFVSTRKLIFAFLFLLQAVTIKATKRQPDDDQPSSSNTKRTRLSLSDSKLYGDGTEVTRAQQEEPAETSGIGESSTIAVREPSSGHDVTRQRLEIGGGISVGGTKGFFQGSTSGTELSSSNV